MYNDFLPALWPQCNYYTQQGYVFGHILVDMFTSLIKKVIDWGRFICSGKAICQHFINRFEWVGILGKLYHGI